MLKKTIRLLRGSVRVRARSIYPERVLNLCSARGIEFWDPAWESASELSLCIFRGDLRALRRACEGIGAELTVERKEGAPFFLARFRRRYALLAGFALCTLLLVVNSFFIWDFEVSGNEKVPSEKILRALRDAGVHRGSFIYSFDSQELCSRVLPELKDLCWLTVNVHGCRAYVQVRERIHAPERVNESTPTNVVASRAGLVTKVRALDGEKLVLPGMSVQAGQLLISGVADTGGTENPSVATRFFAGKGEVWARTWYELSIRIPLSYEEKIYTGEKKKSHALCWGENRVKIGTKGSSILDSSCDKIKNQTSWTLFGILSLPVTWETETSLRYETRVCTRTRAEAEEIGAQALRSHLASLIGEDGSVARERIASAQQGQWLLVTLSAECEQQIGKEVPIEMNER